MVAFNLSVITALLKLKSHSPISSWHILVSRAAFVDRKTKGLHEAGLVMLDTLIGGLGDLRGHGKSGVLIMLVVLLMQSSFHFDQHPSTTAICLGDPHLCLHALPPSPVFLKKHPSPGRWQSHR